MKNDETTHFYGSVFAAHMADFIRYKRAQGLKYDAVPYSLRSFSRFLSAEGGDDASIGKELIEEWCSFRPNENRLTQRRRMVEMTQFLKYLSERGVNVHLPHRTRKSRAREAFVPYIFSNEELRRFFEQCGRLSARTPSVMPVMLPVLFRLLLGCGLRISEALGLRLGDTDLDSGILLIRKSKLNKDRLIPLSDSLLPVLRGYSATYHKIPKGDKEPFLLTGTAAQSVRTTSTMVQKTSLGGGDITRGARQWPQSARFSPHIFGLFVEGHDGQRDGHVLCPAAPVNLSWPCVRVCHKAVCQADAGHVS